MNTDFRVRTDFHRSPKVEILARKLGVSKAEAAYYILGIWTYVAVSKPDGDITGVDPITLSVSAGYEGDEVVFMHNLVDVGFIDDINGVLVVHNWLKHNPYASGAVERSEKSRFSKMKAFYPAIYKELKDKGVDKISSEMYSRISKGSSTDAQAVVKEMLSTNASPTPTPVPTPVPTPTPVNSKKQKDNYGTFENVLLTPEEKTKLDEKFKGAVDDRINTLSEYMKSKGKRYKDHYATILAWARKDEQKKPPTVNNYGSGKKLL